MPTEIKLVCLIFGNPMDKAFTVNITDTESVSDLKRCIKVRKSKILGDLDEGEFDLFHVNIPFEDGRDRTEDGLAALFGGLNINEQEPLFGGVTLEDIFQDIPRGRVHILIKLLSFIDSPGHPPTAPLDVQKSRAAFLHARTRVAPSSAGRVPDFEKYQAEPEKMIPCNRPHNATETIPVTLHHPVFGQFKDDCEMLTPTREDNALVLKLQKILSRFYDREEGRAEAVRDVFRDVSIILTRTYIEGTRFNTDGDTRSADGIYRFNISEFKNELTSGGAEPYFQASMYYLESTRKYADQMPHSVLPCILLLVFGPHMYFAGAAWNGTRPVIQVLSSALSFHMHHSDTNLRTMAARHLGAYRKANQSLKHYYNIELTNFKSTIPSTRVEFPYPTQFTALDGTKLTFDYTQQLDSDKLIFFGRLRGRDDLVCIKFARSYSQEVHEACVLLDIAPRLWGFEKIPGSWYMIVMDRIDVDYSSYDLFRTSSNFDATRAARLHNAIRVGLRAVHDKGYVHGDIRNVNLMVAKNGDAKFRLIDFDWAGEAGKARYPMNVHTGALLWRPHNAYDGELITVEHDNQMMEIIIGSE